MPKVLEDGLTRVEAENDEAHLQKSNAAAELDKRVLQCFDLKIAALTTDRSTSPPVPSAPARGQLALVEAPPQDTLAQLEQYKKQIEDLTAKLQAGVNKVQAEFDKSFDISLQELPQTPPPTKEQMPIYGSIFNAIQHWSVAGACHPFDWEALNQLTGPTVKAAEVASYVMGDILKRWSLRTPASPRPYRTCTPLGRRHRARLGDGWQEPIKNKNLL